MATQNTNDGNSNNEKPALEARKASGGKAQTSEQLRDARMARHSGTVYRTATDGLTAVVMVDKDFPCAYGYRGRSMKPVFRYRFGSVEQREKHVSDWLEGANASIAEHAAIKAERRAPHSLVVGDVLYSSWGYEQTNIDFYEVIAVRGAVVDLIPIKQERNEHAHGMQGTCVAIKGAHKGEPMKGKRPTGQNAVRLSSYATATPWDGRPLGWSSYA